MEYKIARKREEEEKKKGVGEEQIITGEENKVRESPVWGKGLKGDK